MTEEQVFVMLKPDAVERGLTETILNKVKSTGLRLLKSKMLNPSREKIGGWYDQKDKFSKKIYPPKEAIVRYLMSGSIMPTVWSGDNALKKIRKVVGEDTDPLLCKEGSIRRGFGADTIQAATKEGRAVKNLIHASRSLDSAKREITFWFD